jgi:hypothetical protein
MTYLTVYINEEGEIMSHQSTYALDFAREVQAKVLYRAVIDGVVVEDDGSVLDHLDHVDHHAVQMLVDEREVA